MSRKRRPVKIPNHDRGGKTQKSTGTNQKPTGTEGIQLAQPTPLPVPVPLSEDDLEQKIQEANHRQYLNRKAEKIAARIKVDGYLVQPMKLCTHGTSTGWSNWYCQCPLCRYARRAWNEDTRLKIEAEKRRGSKSNLVMVDPAQITEGLLGFYANCDTQRIPYEVKQMIEARHNPDASNGYHEETQIDMPAEPFVPPATPEETTEAIPAQPEQESDDDDEEYYINPSKCAVIKHRNGSAIYTMRSGAVVTITPPK